MVEAARNRPRLVVATLPPLVRAGAAFLGLGLVGDAAVHLGPGAPRAHPDGVAFMVHLAVAAGMVLCLAGLVLAGLRSARPRRRDAR